MYKNKLSFYLVKYGSPKLKEKIIMLLNNMIKHLQKFYLINSFEFFNEAKIKIHTLSISIGSQSLLTDRWGGDTLISRAILTRQNNTVTHDINSLQLFSSTRIFWRLIHYFCAPVETSNLVSVFKWWHLLWNNLSVTVTRDYGLLPPCSLVVTE